MMRIVSKTVLVALAWVAVSCSERSAVQQAEFGQTYLLLGDYAAAEEAFREAIDLDPENGAAHLGLARCQSIAGDPDAALTSYQKAAASPESAAAACFEAAFLSMKMEAPANEWAERLAQLDAESADILHAQIAARRGGRAEAIATLEQARETYGDASRAAIALAWMLAGNKQIDEAVAVYNAAVNAGAKGDDVAMLRAELRNRGALSLEAPDEPYAQAWEYAQMRSWEDARALAEPFASGPNATPWANMVLGYCALAQEAPREAERLLRLAAFELPEQAVVRDLLTMADGAERAPVVAQEAPSEPQADWETLWRTGRLERLLRERAEGQHASAPGEVVYLAALIAGNSALAEKLATRLSVDSPLHEYAAAMAVAIRDGDPQRLMELVESWPLDDMPDPAIAYNAAARAFGVAQLRARALERILTCLGEAPDHSAALYNMATLYREAEMPAHEAEAWRRLLARHPDHAEAADRVYALLVHERRYEEARRLAEAAYINDPNDRTSLIRLADVSLKLGDMDFATAALQRNLERHPDDPLVVRAAARGYLATGAFEPALELLGQGESDLALRAYALAMSASWDEALNACEASGSAPVLHAALLARSQQYGDASAVLPRDDRTASAAQRWFAALLQTANGSQAVEEGDTKLVSDTNAFASFALGTAYSVNGFAAPAVEQWLNALEMIGPNGQLAVLLLDQLSRSRSVVDRMLAAKHVVERHAAMPQAWVAVSDVYASLDNDTERRASLDRAAALADDDAEVWLSIAQRLEPDELGFMLEVFEQLHRLKPDDAMVQNNYAYALLQSGADEPDPLPMAQAAFDALGPRSQVLHTLGLALVRDGQVETGREKLYQALEKRPGDPTLMLDFGKALLARNETDEGRRLVRASVVYADRLNVPFPRKAEAESLLAGDAA